VTAVFTLLVLFQLKHFLADYPLQTRYMLGKFRDDWGFVPPLFAHVCVHGLMTFAIVAAFKPPLAAPLMLFDVAVHFAMDRLKAGKKYLGRWKTLTADTAPTATAKDWWQNHFFWWAVGFDQAVHHLTHYVIIYMVVR
jgi:hypothetical protein